MPTLLTSLGVVPESRLNEWLSGLWLLAGDIERSHSISQNIENLEGSFLHGIMHRREGDFSNAKYWFRRVGNHPVVEQLTVESEGKYVGGAAFVDQVMNSLRGDEATQTQSQTQSQTQCRAQCREIQWLEWQALMVYCLD